jgi:hypothetical protein
MSRWALSRRPAPWLVGMVLGLSLLACGGRITPPARLLRRRDLLSLTAVIDTSGNVQGRPQYWASLAEIDTAATFLGSYAISAKTSSDCCEYEFRASNDTSWESATRLRQSATPGGTNQGILRSRDRETPGIQLGGNMRQVWKWKEKLGAE